LLVGYQEICRELLPAGWEMVEPGLVPVTRWRPEEDVPTIEDEIRFYGLIAREQ
jgi:hypothetical protein